MSWLEQVRPIWSRDRRERSLRRIPRVLRITLRKPLPLVAALIGLLCGGVVFGQQPDPRYAAGVRHQQAGELEQAVAAYRELLSDQPGHVGARSNLGAALAALGRYDEAISEYRQALDSFDHPGIRRNLGLAYYKSGRISEAAAEFASLRRQEPGNPDLAILEADCRLRLGEPDAVVEILGPLEAGHTDNLGLAYLLGTAHIRSGNVEEGQRLIEKILSHGESAEVHLMLAMALLRGAELEKAVTELEMATERNPKLATAWSLLGTTRLKLNDHARAEEALRSAASLDANDFDAHFYLGVILRETARPEEALPFIEHASRLRPASPKTRYQLGSLLLQLKQYEEARKVLETLVEETPDFPEAHLSLATACHRLGDRAAAGEHRRLARELMLERSGEQDEPARYESAGVPEP